MADQVSKTMAYHVINRLLQEGPCEITFSRLSQELNIPSNTATKFLVSYVAETTPPPQYSLMLELRRHPNLDPQHQLFHSTPLIEFLHVPKKDQLQDIVNTIYHAARQVIVSVDVFSIWSEAPADPLCLWNSEISLRLNQEKPNTSPNIPSYVVYRMTKDGKLLLREMQARTSASCHPQLLDQPTSYKPRHLCFKSHQVSEIPHDRNKRSEPSFNPKQQETELFEKITSDISKPCSSHSLPNLYKVTTSNSLSQISGKKQCISTQNEILVKENTKQNSDDQELQQIHNAEILQSYPSTSNTCTTFDPSNTSLSDDIWRDGSDDDAKEEDSVIPSPKPLSVIKSPKKSPLFREPSLDSNQYMTSVKVNVEKKSKLGKYTVVETVEEVRDIVMECPKVRTSTSSASLTGASSAKKQKNLFNFFKKC